MVDVEISESGTFRALSVKDAEIEKLTAWNEELQSQVALQQMTIERLQARVKESEARVTAAMREDAQEIERLTARVEELERGINLAGGLSSQGAGHELIRQVLAEAIAATEQGESDENRD